MPPAQPLIAFLAAARKQFAQAAGPASRRTAELLAAIEAPVAGAAGSALSETWSGCGPPAEIAALLRTPTPSPGLVAVHGFYRDLDWRRSPRSDGPVAEVVGPGCAIAHDTLRCGLFVLGAGHLYAEHVHGADEVYIVLAGCGDWSLGGSTFAAKSPGDAIEVPSMTPHALRTGKQPLLMLWSWTGDITFERYRFT